MTALPLARKRLSVLPLQPLLALLSFGICALAEEPNPLSAPPAPTDATAAMRNWIESVDTDWQAVYAKEVTAPAQVAKEKATAQYLAVAEVNFARATTAGDLDQALVWQRERDGLKQGWDVPEEDEAETPAEMKKQRTLWRTEMARIEKERLVRSKAVQARYDQVLANAQLQLTQRQRIDEALLVKKKRDEIAAAWAPPANSDATPAASAAETAKNPTGPNREFRLTPDVATQRLANVEVQGAQIVKLAKDEKLWTDRPVKWLAIPTKYAAFKFTQLPAHSTTLRFKVLTDGVVAMGCSARWGSTADPASAKDFYTEQKLTEAGWVRQKQDQLATTASDMQFLIFARHCKAGEEFAYRTEKYAPPILLMR